MLNFMISHKSDFPFIIWLKINLNGNRRNFCWRFNFCRFLVCPWLFFKFTFDDVSGAVLVIISRHFWNYLRIFMQLIECDRRSGLVAFNVHFNACKHLQHLILWCWFVLISGECFAPFHTSHGCCKFWHVIDCLSSAIVLEAMHMDWMACLCAVSWSLFVGLFCGWGQKTKLELTRSWVLSYCLLTFFLCVLRPSPPSWGSLVCGCLFASWLNAS